VAANDFRVRRDVRDCVTSGAVACIWGEDTSFLPAFSFAVMVVCGSPDSEETRWGGGTFTIPVLGVVVCFVENRFLVALGEICGARTR
jgi:hypothetical protein